MEPWQTPTSRLFPPCPHHCCRAQCPDPAGGGQVAANLMPKPPCRQEQLSQGHFTFLWGLRAVPLSFPPGDRGRASQGGAREDS